MDKKILKMAADVMRQLSLTEIKIKDGDTEIEMKREASCINAAPDVVDKSIVNDAVIDDEKEDRLDVLCPLIGVFHRSSEPSSPPFVNVGSKVKAGDVLCIIEAMKMMTEITAECDGTVASIYAEDGNLVEYGQPLFCISIA